MKSFAHVGMFEQMCAIEISQTMRIGREVRGNPVEDHANPMLVQIIHQVHEILRRTVARGRREIASGLVSPGTIERMFHHWQQFNVGKLHVVYVLRQARRQLAII